MVKTDNEKDIKLSEIPIIKDIVDGKAKLVDSKVNQNKSEPSFNEWTIEVIKLLGKKRKLSKKVITEASVSDLKESEGKIRVKLGNEEWLIFRTFDNAKDYAINIVKEELNKDRKPWEYFSKTWLINFLYMEDNQINQWASNESKTLWEDSVKRDNDQVKRVAEKYGMGNDFDHYIMENSLEDLDIKEQDLMVRSSQEFWEKLEEFWRNDYESDIKEGLKNPYQYFVKDQGIYTIDQLFEQSFIEINIEKASRDFVDTDGITIILAPFDNQQVELNESYAYRQN